MKKIVLTAATIALAATTAFAAPQRVSLKVWESDGPEKDYIMWAIKAYKKIDPKAKITYEPVASTDARAKIELDGPAGVGADVFVTPHDHIGALVSGGHVLPIDDPDTYMADFIDSAKMAAAYDGTYYGYPLGAETYALFFNKKLISEAPKTWEEVIAFAKTFNNKAEGKYALVWPVADGYYGYMFMDSFGAPLFGPNGNDRKQHNLNSPAAIEGLTYFQGLRKQILDIPAADASGDFCNAQFTEGKSAMIITGPWKITDFKKSGVDFGITTVPAFPEKNQPATTFSGVRLAFVSSYSEFPDAAKAFARFITSKEALEQRFKLTDQIPPRVDINMNTPMSNGIKEQLVYSKPMPTIPQLGTYWSAMGSAYSGIWDGDNVRTDLNAAAAAMEAAK
ncbi:MAG: maltose ABC transporter substrate-binding protein [Treponemataceae bacterium]|nr:maltose ABC transporter substrate-binding protein [Treponemataceae bacterium]